MTERLFLTLILLAAAALRLVGIHNQSPPGPSHDEVANWLIDQQILSGEHAVYFQEAYGHEAGFHYLQAGFVSLLGDHVLALRLPAAFSGLLLLPVLWVLSRLMFAPHGRRHAGWRSSGKGSRLETGPLPVAMLATALAAVMFWALLYSRQGLRAITLPLIAGLAAYFWWRGWNRAPHWRMMGGAGIVAGLSLYTYMAARAIPLIFLLFVAYLALFHRSALRQRRWGVLLFFLTMIAMALPLLLFLINSPGAEFRISEIDAPLQSLLAGDLRPVLANGGRILGMLGFSGDPLARNNLPRMPLFGPTLALLSYGGILLATMRWRQPAYAFLLIWLVVGATPSMVTVDAPSNIRLISLLVFVPLLPMLSLQFLEHVGLRWARPSWGSGVKQLVMSVAVGLLLLHAWRSSKAIFKQWPAQPEVQFVWQEALTDAAQFLDAHPEIEQASLAGWTPNSMDPPTMKLTMRRESVRLLHFDPSRTLLLASGTPIWLLHPTILPLREELASQLAAWGAKTSADPSITTIQLNENPQPVPAIPLNGVFQNSSQQKEMTLLGVKPLSDGAFISYWRIEGRPEGPRRIFLHALSAAGEIVAQSDGLEAPVAPWRPGDLLLQYHAFDQAIKPAAIQIGVYNPVSQLRLMLPGGATAITLPSATGEQP